MMQLPATLNEAEARACARKWLVERGEYPDAFGLGVSVLDPQLGGLWLREALKRIALVHPLNMMWVIDQAREGWDAAAAALSTLIIEMQSRGETLPTELLNYNMEVHREVMRGRPHRKRGPKKETHVFQDIIFAGLAADLVEQFDLKPTRNSVSKQVSACDVVADTVNEAKIGRAVKYKAIEVLWFRWGKGLLSDQYWANLSRP
jgi:hypothetical protein